MDTRRKFWFVLIGTILGAAIIACSCGSLSTSPTSVSQPTLPHVSSSAPHSTLAVPDQQICNGWRLRLIRVESSSSQGMDFLTGYTTIENVNANVSTDFYDNGLSPAFYNSQMTTAEGYSYQITGGNVTNLLGSFHHIPPGFRYKIGYVGIQVATGATHRILKTPCGTLDFDNPETNLKYPTDMASSSFYAVDAPIVMPEGTLTIISAVYGDNGQDCSNAGTVCIHYTFTNASKGYNANIDFGAFIVGNDGIATDLNLFLSVNAGPGQTFDGVSQLPISTKTGNKLILANGDSAWVVNIP